MAARRTRKMKSRKVKRTIRYFDYSLLAVLIFLICFGLVMLYSTSYYSAQTKFNDGMFYLKKQIRATAISFFAMWFVLINYHRYVKYAKEIYYFSIVLMAMVMIPGVGIEAYGARRWIKVPIFGQMQPAEVTKIAVILFIPVLLCKIGKEINTRQGLFRVLGWGGAAAACVLFLTDNLSTAIIVMGMSCVMIFVVHPKTAPFLGLGIAGVASVGIAAQVLGRMLTTSENFRMRRVLVRLRPEEYAAEGGFQVMQAQYAIGSGGFWGKGLGNSAQKMIIPEAQNDMILSIICEEIWDYSV